MDGEGVSVLRVNHDWMNSIWQAVEAGQGLDWADFEWYAVDRYNSIAFFTSAGPGPIPRTVFRDRDQYIAITEFFRSLPLNGHAKILNEYPKTDDWRHAAERGLYAFDYDRWNGRMAGYYMVARPEKLLQIEDLPAWVRYWLEQVTLKDVVFAESIHSPVDPLEIGLDNLQ